VPVHSYLEFHFLPSGWVPPPRKGFDGELVIPLACNEVSLQTNPRRPGRSNWYSAIRQSGKWLPQGSPHTHKCGFYLLYAHRRSAKVFLASKACGVWKNSGISFGHLPYTLKYPAANFHRMLRGLNQKELDNVVSQMVSDMGEPQPGSAQEKGIIEIKGDIVKSNFQTFHKAEISKMLAVDGGSATILNAGSFVVAGVRVGHVEFLGKEFKDASEPDFHLLHLASGHLEKSYEIFFEKIVGSEPPDYPKGLEEAVGRIRALMEWSQVGKILAHDIPEGAVLAFDGAMWAGIKGVGDLLERIVEQARQKKIILCGISKKSMLTHNSKPLIPAVQMLGDEIMPDALWHYPLETGNYSEKLFGKIYLAKLHSRSQYVFRVDLSLPEGIEPEQAFGKLAYYADDPTYVGYPYPLARVHNDIAFSRAEVADLKAMLRSEALQKGMNPKEWQLTFQDFHEILDTSR